MCGRFTLTETGETLVEQLGLVSIPKDYRPRFNIAPSQEVLAARDSDMGRRAAFLRWGLVPFWARDPKIGNKMINARAETVSERPSFRIAFEKRRCIIPADGFYEWRPSDRGKVPVRFVRRDRRVFAFAGLWEAWRLRKSHRGPDSGTETEPDGERPGQMGRDGPPTLFTCTIITTEANELIRPVHHRMPVILDEEGIDVWLDRDVPGSGVRHLLRPFPADEMEAYEVSPKVNAATYDDVSCITPVRPLLPE